jgi:hypothetical protein
MKDSFGIPVRLSALEGENKPVPPELPHGLFYHLSSKYSATKEPGIENLGAGSR